LTAQNTQKVHAIHDVPIDFLRKQIDVVLEDIQFDAIKIGMLSSVEIIDCVVLALKSKFKKIPLILDPVMVATSGDILLQKNAIENLKKKLINKAFLVTPNIDEAEILSGMKIRNLSEMRDAASQIKNLGCEAVLIKGGHLTFADGKIHSLLLDYEDEFYIISNKKVGMKNIHGTGCTLASAIASNVAKKTLSIKKFTFFSVISILLIKRSILLISLKIKSSHLSPANEAEWVFFSVFSIKKSGKKSNFCNVLIFKYWFG
jgi:hydroxymethylpyrimidine/phosphomethylpyrimidine kinase